MSLRDRAIGRCRPWPEAHGNYHTVAPRTEAARATLGLATGCSEEPDRFKPTSVPSQWGVETFTDELRQLANGVGFREEIAVFQQRNILARHAGTVAAGVNHFEGGGFLHETLG